MKKTTDVKRNSSRKPRVTELRERFEYIKASFEIEGIHFSKQELASIEDSIRKRHRGQGFVTTAKALLKT